MTGQDGDASGRVWVTDGKVLVPAGVDASHGMRAMAPV